MTRAAHAPMIAYLDAQSALSTPAAVALRVAVVLDTWARRQRTRRALAQLDAHLLRDVGLDRRDAIVESRRMFWQG